MFEKRPNNNINNVSNKVTITKSIVWNFQVALSVKKNRVCLRVGVFCE